MGNFDDHTRYGHAAYVLLTIALVGAIGSGGLAIGVGVLLAVLAYPFVRIGAAFPDIDHHASRPHRGLRRIVFVLGTVASVFILYTQTLIPVDALVAGVEINLGTDAKVGLLIHGVSLLIGVGLRESVSYFRPKHRGITHRVPTGVAVAGGFGGLAGYIASVLTFSAPAVVATVVGGAFFAGFLSHLQCDQMLLPAVRGSIGSIGRTLRKVRHASPL